MKRLLTVLLCCLPFVASAQDKDEDLTGTLKVLDEAAEAVAAAPRQEPPKVKRSTFWKNSLLTRIAFEQTSLTNWAAGGNNTIALQSSIDGNANYKRNEMFWNNRLQLDYGFVYAQDKPFLQKSNDRIYLESKWGYQAVKTLYVSAEFSFKSQFSNSYNYPKSLPDGKEGAAAWKEARTLKSGCISPAYTSLGVGLDYRPLKWLTVNFSPVTGGFVIVDKPGLRKSYSMPLKKEFEDVKLTDEDKKAGHCYVGTKFEFGAQLKVDVKVNVNDNFKYSSQILLFSDYLDHPENMRVNWDNRIDWKFSKYFSFSIVTNLIYDDKVMIKNEKDLEKYPDGKQRVQFKEHLSFGFVYTFQRKN